MNQGKFCDSPDGPLRKAPKQDFIKTILEILGLHARLSMKTSSIKILKVTWFIFTMDIFDLSKPSMHTIPTVLLILLIHLTANQTGENY